MTNANLDRFGTMAAEYAMRAAVDFARSQNARPDYAVWSAALKSAMRTAVPIALDDARQALDAGMTQVAEATFLATLKLAAIRATKEVIS